MPLRRGAHVPHGLLGALHALEPAATRRCDRPAAHWRSKGTAACGKRLPLFLQFVALVSIGAFLGRYSVMRYWSTQYFRLPVSFSKKKKRPDCQQCRYFFQRHTDSRKCEWHMHAIDWWYFHSKNGAGTPDRRPRYFFPRFFFGAL